MANVSVHPLLITLRDAISGDGFLVGITLSGRATMQFEDGKWWMYGVRPAAVAASGSTPQEAFLDFRNRYKEVLFDIAEEHRTFESFKKEVERFFYEPDQEEERRWDDALTAVRASNSKTPPEPFSGLPKESPETWPAQISIEQLDGVGKRFMPSDNVQDQFAKAA